MSEITVLYLLWCALNYILTYVSRKTSYSSQDCLSLTYHSSLDIFTTITHSAFYKPDHGKITTLRVSNQILIHYLIIGLSRQIDSFLCIYIMFCVFRLFTITILFTISPRITTCLHLTRTCWPIIQKVRSHMFIKLTLSCL